jgi:hypothetical protein
VHGDRCQHHCYFSADRIASNRIASNRIDPSGWCRDETDVVPGVAKAREKARKRQWSVGDASDVLEYVGAENDLRGRNHRSETAVGALERFDLPDDRGSEIAP